MLLKASKVSAYIPCLNFTLKKLNRHPIMTLNSDVFKYQTSNLTRHYSGQIMKCPVTLKHSIFVSTINFTFTHEQICKELFCSVCKPCVCSPLKKTIVRIQKNVNWPSDVFNKIYYIFILREIVNRTRIKLFPVVS